MRVRRKALLTLAIGVGLGLAAWWLWPVVHALSSHVLRWEDPTTKATFVVTEKLGSSFHTYTHLSVSTKDGHFDRVQLDDDAGFGTASLVRWKDWLLVVNDDYVMGGYNFATGTLYGEHQWDQLPFTVRKNAGEVVAQKRVRAEGNIPAQFPIIHEGSPRARSETQPSS